MLITLELPEDIAKELETRWTDLPRAALESLADPGFWATGPVVLWDRYTAVARAARAAAVRSDGTADATWGGSGDPGRAAGYPPAAPPEPGWQKPAPPFPRRWS